MEKLKSHFTTRAAKEAKQIAKKAGFDHEAIAKYEGLMNEPNSSGKLIKKVIDTALKGLDVDQVTAAAEEANAAVKRVYFKAEIDKEWYEKAFAASYGLWEIVTGSAGNAARIKQVDANVKKMATQLNGRLETIVMTLAELKDNIAKLGADTEE